MVLTASNYYSREANMAYMSASQLKSFRRCEAAALAELNGEYSPTPTKALLLGSFVDAYFSGELNEFIEAHPEIRKKDGTLTKDFEKAWADAVRLDSDELAHALLAGRHQVIKTGTIAGVPFKCKIDSLLTPAQVKAICSRFPAVKRLVPFGGGMIVDLKYMGSIQSVWNEETQCRISYIQYWGYDIQGAIYQKLEGTAAPFILVGATKEAETNIFAHWVPDADLDGAMADVETLAPRYQSIKEGLIVPTRCGKCPYCRRTHHLTDITFAQIDYE